MIKAVIFDCDGVLVDSEPVTDRVIGANLRARGLDWTAAEIGSRFRGGTIHALGEVARAAGGRIEEGWAEALYEDAYAALEDEVQPIPGALALLDRLDAAGVPYAVGSNGPMRKMEVTLGRCGMRDRLQGRLLSAQVVGRAKPAPDVYLAAANLLGVAPEEAVVVEDTG